MEDNIAIECCCQDELSAVLSFRLPHTVEFVHRSHSNVHFCPLLWHPMSGWQGGFKEQEKLQSQSCTKAGIWSVLGGFTLLVQGAQCYNYLRGAGGLGVSGC